MNKVSSAFLKELAAELGAGWAVAKVGALDPEEEDNRVEVLRCDNLELWFNVPWNAKRD